MQSRNPRAKYHAYPKGRPELTEAHEWDAYEREQRRVRIRRHTEKAATIVVVIIIAILIAYAGRSI